MESEKKLSIDRGKSSILFEKAMKKFQVKKVLYRTLFKGKGLEFDGYRYFDDDDDFDLIDWKATLRSGQKMIRQYKEERDVSVYFLVDCSKKILFGSGSKLKAEYIGELVCALTHLVLGSGDKAGLIMYSDKEVKVLKASNKQNQFFIIRKFLSDLENYKGEFNLSGALEFCSKLIKGPSNNLVVLSDFIRIKKGFEKNLTIMSSKADIFALMVRDKMDEVLPNLNYKMIVEDPYSGRQMTIDSRIARIKYAEHARKQKEKIKDLFKQKGVDILELKNSEEFALPLSTFMKRRAQEIRV